jgi:hypothetical protein
MVLRRCCQRSQLRRSLIEHASGQLDVGRVVNTMDLKNHIFSVLLLLTASDKPPPEIDRHPTFLQGVWECKVGDEFIRLALDGDGTYEHWAIPERRSDSVGHGFIGDWDFAGDLIILSRRSKYLTPGDGEDRERAIRHLQEMGWHSAAEGLARTHKGWLPLAEEDQDLEAFRVRPWGGKVLSLSQWMIRKTDDDYHSAMLDIECQRQTLEIKPRLLSGA